MLSKNIYKRKLENETYMRIRNRFLLGWGSYRSKLSNWRKGLFKGGNSGGKKPFRPFFGREDKTTPGIKYWIYPCPNCKQEIRVPGNRGKIAIRCPKCGTEFIKDS